MADNIIAYVGLNSFDIILYMSRIMLKIGRKVLVVDNSDTSALTCSIPQIPEVDTRKEFLTFRRVDFTTMGIEENTAKLYDDILIDCGMNKPISKSEFFTRVIYVTDMFNYNMARISQIPYYNDLQIMSKLLIREATNTKLTTEYIIEKVKKPIAPGLVSILYRDDRDYTNSLLCHYNQVFSFTHVSGMMKEYLLSEVQSLYPDHSMKEIRTAYDKAKKGD